MASKHREDAHCHITSFVITGKCKLNYTEIPRLEARALKRVTGPNCKWGWGNWNSWKSPVVDGAPLWEALLQLIKEFSRPCLWLSSPTAGLFLGKWLPHRDLYLHVHSSFARMSQKSVSPPKWQVDRGAQGCHGKLLSPGGTTARPHGSVEESHRVGFSEEKMLRDRAPYKSTRGTQHRLIRSDVKQGRCF